MQIYIRYNPKHKTSSKKAQPWQILIKGGEWIKVDHITSFVGFTTKETPVCKGFFAVLGQAEFSKTQDGKTWVHIHPEGHHAKSFQGK